MVGPSLHLYNTTTYQVLHEKARDDSSTNVGRQHPPNLGSPSGTITVYYLPVFPLAYTSWAYFAP